MHHQLQSHGGGEPLDFWELGYSWDNTSTYDPQAHARDEIKIFATAVGKGGSRAVQFKFTNDTASIGYPGIIDNSGPRPAAESFQLLAQKLNGATDSQRLNIGPSVWGYNFQTPTGIIDVVWSDATSVINLPFNTTEIRATDITGAQTLVNPQSFTVTDSPLMIESANTSNFNLFVPLVKR